MKNSMKKALKILVLFGVGLLCSSIPGTYAQIANYVPDYYYANYKFADDWDAILEWFTKAKAKYSVDQSFSTSEFVALSKHFKKVFPHLTKDYSMVYEKCTLLADSLSHGYSYTDMEALMWNACYKSLIQAINNINSSYTVIPSVSVNPSNWMAPLTVTFDARNSSDPSEETLPTAKFYWYYRDENEVDTPMGEGQIINYTFEESWKFIVHLVVRSSNVNKWILDGERNVTINVTPKAADIVVYANTRRMTKNEQLKMWVTEWEKWVIFDGSLTVPRWWRKILSHQWTIVNPSIWFSYDSKVQKWTPSFINVPLKWNWEFQVTLTVWDNENNKVSQTYSLYMSDPVTIIRQTPVDWTTSTTYNFDWSASYSITSRLNTYYWEVFDANGWDDQWVAIKWSNDKKMSINFASMKKRPWNYLVRLTVTDIAGNKNEETRPLYVESTPPVPQFTAVPTKVWTYPSEFTLDASNSSDIDAENWLDSLEYSWSFSSPNDVTIISTENNNEKMVVRFNKKGEHKITLTVTDQYWKSSSITKTLDIKSILRPEFEAKPGVITWEQDMSFTSQVNETNIYEYEWNFWDGTSNASQFNTNAQHKFAQKWMYTVVLKVTDGEGNWNDVRERVFVWEIDSPIAAFKVKDANWYGISDSNVCKETDENWNIISHPAFPIDRYAKFTIDPSISQNTKWNNNGLKYAFTKQWIVWQDKAKIASTLTESFSEVWCHYVDLQVSDPNIWKEDSRRIWFDVQNALPTLKNVTLTFPQYWDDQSVIGFGTTDSNRTAFDCSWASNLTIKVTAVYPEDSDWTISRLRFYYYNVDDPDRRLEYKDTWLQSPFVYFVLPRIWWEFKFWVMVYDNDGWMIDSDDFLASNPSIYFPASCSDADIPNVTLRVDRNNIKVWDTVTYTIVSKIDTYNEDFATDRTFYYDFTWDWVWDLITKKDKATYTFMDEYEDGVVPRAAVEYRRKLWKADGDTIYVKNGIRPILLYNSIWNTVIFRDISMWVFQQRRICFEESECIAWNRRFLREHIVSNEYLSNNWEPLSSSEETPITKNDTFIQKYQSNWKHKVSIYLKSIYWIEAETWFKVTTVNDGSNWKLAPWINMITIPETTFNSIMDPETWKVKDIRPEVFLSKDMKDSLVLYINNENWGRCYVDTDIATDSDWDWDKEHDSDVECNKIAKIKYEPNYESSIWRVYFMTKDDNWKEALQFKNFYVSFEWYVIELNDEDRKIYDDIMILVDWIDDITQENVALKTNLDQLRKSLNSVTDVTALIVAIKEQMNVWWLNLDSKQKELLESIVSRLENTDTIVAVSVWMDWYQRNKEEILAILRTNTTQNIEFKEGIRKMFLDFEENVPDGLDDKYKALDSIWEKISKYYKKDENVVNEFTPFFCSMYEYYDIQSYTDKCSVSTEQKVVQKNYDSSENEKSVQWEKKWWFPVRLTIVLIVLWWWILAMVLTVVYFSIKARRNSSSEEEW